jgi:hypothetical protein
MPLPLERRHEKTKVIRLRVPSSSVEANPHPGGNPDASRSFAERDSVGYVRHDSSDRAGLIDSAGPSHAVHSAGRPAHRLWHNKSDRGRSDCRWSRGRGSGHTETGELNFRPLWA